ncbi:MAG: hypothetical protein IIU45_02965, partial [Lachnospiraceae bacterium]|nr:hypothetical protein [Lachnospiraceae bacterium]
MQQTKGRTAKKENFVKQAGILAAAGIIVRIIGLLYRSPLTSIIGDEGNGYYGERRNFHSNKYYIDDDYIEEYDDDEDYIDKFYDDEDYIEEFDDEDYTEEFDDDEDYTEEFD